jgi:hypothetical protein
MQACERRLKQTGGLEKGDQKEFDTLVGLRLVGLRSQVVFPSCVYRLVHWRESIRQISQGETFISCLRDLSIWSFLVMSFEHLWVCTV